MNKGLNNRETCPFNVSVKELAQPTVTDYGHDSRISP